MRKFVYWTVVVSLWVCTAGGAVLAAASKITPDALGNLPAILHHGAGWLQRQYTALTLAPICVALFAALKSIMTPPWVDKALLTILNTMRDHAFPNLPATQHQVTLFRLLSPARPCWQVFRLPTWESPFGGWLIPFARSGSIPLNSTACFKPNHARYEGVAGYTFANNTTPDIQNLVPPTNWTATDPAVNSYACSTLVSPDWVAKNKPKACTLIGIPVMVKGIPWGAIVLDSRNSTLPNSQQLINSFKLLAVVLGQILERI